MTEHTWTAQQAAKLNAEVQILQARLAACRETARQLRGDLRDVTNDARRITALIDDLDIP